MFCSHFEKLECSFINTLGMFYVYDIKQPKAGQVKMYEGLFHLIISLNDPAHQTILDSHYLIHSIRQCYVCVQVCICSFSIKTMMTQGWCPTYSEASTVCLPCGLAINHTSTQTFSVKRNKNKTKSLPFINAKHEHHPLSMDPERLMRWERETDRYSPKYTSPASH